MPVLCTPVVESAVKLPQKCRSLLAIYLRGTSVEASISQQAYQSEAGVVLVAIYAVTNNAKSTRYGN
jgi:hypothetical protein